MAFRARRSTIRTVWLRAKEVIHDPNGSAQVAAQQTSAASFLLCLDISMQLMMMPSTGISSSLAQQRQLLEMLRLA